MLRPCAPALSATATTRSSKSRLAGLDGKRDQNSNGAVTESLLVITGTMGAGKTTVLGEASDILALRGITHAAIDLDALGLAHLPSTTGNDGVMYRNLQSICKNYASVGVKRFLLARAVEDAAELAV